MSAFSFSPEVPFGLDTVSAIVWTLAIAVCVLAGVFFSRRGRK